MGEEPRDTRSNGEVARRGDRPRRVLDSSVRRDLKWSLVVLRERRRPRLVSWSAVGGVTVRVGSCRALPAVAAGEAIFSESRPGQGL